MQRVAMIATAARKERDQLKNYDGSTRAYYPIWIIAKTEKVVDIKVAPHLVSRLKKAIGKEKDMDLVYRMMLEITGRKKERLRYVYNIQTWVLHVELNPYVDACRVSEI